MDQQVPSIIVNITPLCPAQSRFDLAQNNILNHRYSGDDDDDDDMCDEEDDVDITS